MKGRSEFEQTYTVKDKLGEGAFGVVYKALNKKSKEFVAIKIISVEGDVRSMRRLLREILLLKHLKHENLILLKDAYVIYQNSQISIIFVTELMKMNLRHLLRDFHRTLSTDHIKFFMYQIFLGLTYLHHNHIAHRDLKPDNILVNNLNEIKIADFGWARKICSNDDPLTKIIANIHYRAPEICMRVEEHGPPVDIWAAACVFYEILENKVLFNCNTNAAMIQEIINNFGTPSLNDIGFIKKFKTREWLRSQEFVPQKAPSDYLQINLCPAGKDLFNRCLCFDPNKRITALQAIQHPYFADIFEKAEMQRVLVNHSGDIDFGFEGQRDLTPVDLLKRINNEILSVPKKKKKKENLWSLFKLSF